MQYSNTAVFSKDLKSIDRKNLASAKIKERYLLTQKHSTKKTYHITLDLKGIPLSFKPGDSLGIYPQNDPLLVRHLLEAMRATGEEIILDPKSKTSISIGNFLTFKANLARLNTSFLKLFYEYAKNDHKKNELHHLLENKDLLHQYLSTHDPLDLFKKYQQVEAPLQDLCSQFSPLLPRFYSVASSLMVQPDEVDLLVALFTFPHGEEKRYGVTSHFLCHLATMQTTPIPIYVQPAHAFRLPTDIHTNIIMIGPGTGVAPFRAFLQERVKVGSKGKNWLFFGERNRSSDFFYEDFWAQLNQSGHLRLELAFSRDQNHKIYVQHRMLEQAHELWKWIEEGAIFYICGDANQMAKDVEATLQQIISEQGHMPIDAAKSYVKKLRHEKRYQVDVY